MHVKLKLKYMSKSLKRKQSEECIEQQVCASVCFLYTDFINPTQDAILKKNMTLRFPFARYSNCCRQLR